ncbi:MAG: TIGR00266 family protein [Planctomycetota bacterium]
MDYQIHGDDLQFVEVTLDPGETVIAESGAMMYMTSGIVIHTVVGDPSNEGGFWNKVVSAGKRALTGESLFMNTFTNLNPVNRETIAFASPTVGRIIPMHLDKMGGEIICQKGAFLCGAKGLRVSIAFQKKVGVGFFGGEGFIMQRIVGDGIALVHAGGAMVHRELAAGESLRLDTGCLMAMGPSVEYDIQFVGGFKNTLFGGEGLFMATVTGPGPVWLQSLPFSRLARSIVSTAFVSRKHAEEGSVLSLGIGSLLTGNRQ